LAKHRVITPIEAVLSAMPGFPERRDPVNRLHTPDHFGNAQLYLRIVSRVNAARLRLVGQAFRTAVIAGPSSAVSEHLSASAPRLLDF